VDLGFGQPMEHVLRQCLIALRLADHAGLGWSEPATRRCTGSVSGLSLPCPGIASWTA
jgi:hypothetical protein